MNNIEIYRGLVLLLGRRGEGKTQLALKWANLLAKNERVLYISYQDYDEKILNRLNHIDGKVQPNLEVNCLFDYESLYTYFEILEYIQEEGITTLIIDDLEGFHRYEDYHKNSIQSRYQKHPLRFLVDYLKIRLIVLENRVITPYDDHDETPKIRFYMYARPLINNAHQILALFRPGNREMIDAQGMYYKEVIEIHSLKNREGYNQVFYLDNARENIYDADYKTW